MKIMFSFICFPIWPYPPKLMKKKMFYIGKLYGLTGMLSTLTKNDATFPKLHNDTVPQMCVICK